MFAVKRIRNAGFLIIFGCLSSTAAFGQGIEDLYHQGYQAYLQRQFGDSASYLQTVLSSNGDLVFYGSNYSPIEEQKTHYHYLKIIVLDEEGNLKWSKETKQNYYEKPGNLIETKEGNYLFSSTITPIKDKGDRAYIFELNRNGELTFERKFEYSVGISSVPYLIRTEGQITMIGQKWIGKFGEPFNDIFYITKLIE